MKKTLFIGLALGVAMTATYAFANTPGGSGIVGSSHDLPGGAYGTTDAQDRICVFCHHPHHSARSAAAGGRSDVAYSPLWNRTIPAASNFTAYNNGVMMGSSSTPQHTMNGTPAVGGVSLLCMSCHDGVTAMNAYSNNNGSDTYGADSSGTGSNYLPGAGGALTSNAALGQDLSNHHPIGMDWPAVYPDSEIRDRDTEWGTISVEAVGTGTNGTGIGITIADVLSGGKMECVTCHDVHNTQNQTGAERFLWVSNNRSNFCLTCHAK